MHLKISHLNGSVVFEFQPEPTPVTTFLVADSSEQVRWEIAPVSSEAVAVGTDGGLIGSNFIGVRVPRSLERILSDAAKSDRASYPPLSRVVYGELPTGYREVVRATELTSGEKYCVVVFGAGLESVSDFFTA
jgi:hypothetical protein